MYPLAENAPHLIQTRSGKTLDDLTLAGVMEGTVTPEDIRISGETLKMQAKIAAEQGKKQLSENFLRAAEMTLIPDEEILETYDLLRPNRTDKQTLLERARYFEETYGAVLVAGLIRETADVYEKRKLVRL